MKESLRQGMAWLHTWVGLLAGWVMLFVFVTGTASYFSFEIDRWMRPELPLVDAPWDQASAIGQAQAYLQAHHAHAELWNIGLPVERTQPYLGLFVRDPRMPDGTPGRTYRAIYDAGAAQFVPALPARDTGGGQLLYRMHYVLHYMPHAAGTWIVGIGAMLLLLALISGLIIHKKIFVDFFVFRPGKGQRSWLDAHNLSSVMALPFFLLITYSGLVLCVDTYMPAALRAMYGSDDGAVHRMRAELIPADFPPPAGRPAPLVQLCDVARQAEEISGLPSSAILVRNPGDAAAAVTVRAQREGRRSLTIHNSRFHGVTGRFLGADTDSVAAQTRYTLRALHEGRFAAPALRGLYFLSGALGYAMIATGLVLWTGKRKVRRDKRPSAGRRAEAGYGLVRCLNIGAIAGLPVAIAAYFWANRLIPADFASRRAWEVHTLFITWAVLLLYPAARRSARAWSDELWLAALAFGLLPAVNAVTTQRHLGVTLPAGNWVLAGFDLVMLALGLAFACLAWKAGKVCQAAARSQRVGV